MQLLIHVLYQKLLMLTCLGSWAVKYLPTQLTMDTIAPSFSKFFALKVMGIAEPQPLPLVDILLKIRNLCGRSGKIFV